MSVKAQTSVSLPTKEATSEDKRRRTTVSSKKRDGLTLIAWTEQRLNEFSSWLLSRSVIVALQIVDVRSVTPRRCFAKKSWRAETTTTFYHGCLPRVVR